MLLGAPLTRRETLTSLGSHFQTFQALLWLFGKRRTGRRSKALTALTAAQLQLVMLRIATRKGDKVWFAELLKVNVEAGEEGEEEE